MLSFFQEILRKTEEKWVVKLYDLNILLIEPIKEIYQNTTGFSKFLDQSEEINNKIESIAQDVENSKNSYYLECKNFQNCFIEKKITEDIQHYHLIETQKNISIHNKAKKIYHDMQDKKQAYKSSIKNYKDKIQQLLGKNVNFNIN